MTSDRFVIKRQWNKKNVSTILTYRNRSNQAL